MKFNNSIILASFAVLFSIAPQAYAAPLWQTLQRTAQEEADKGDWKNAQEHFKQSWLLAEHMHAPAQKMKEIQESLEQAYLKNGQDMMVDHLKHVKPKDMRVLLLGITKPKMGDDYDIPMVMAVAASFQKDKTVKVRTETICCGTITRKEEVVLKPGDKEYDLVVGKLDSSLGGEKKLDPFELKSLSAVASEGMKCGKM